MKSLTSYNNESALAHLQSQLEAMSSMPGKNYIVVGEAPQVARVFLYAIRSDDAHALERMANIAVRHHLMGGPPAKWRTVKFNTFKKKMRSLVRLSGDQPLAHPSIGKVTNA